MNMNQRDKSQAIDGRALLKRKEAARRKDMMDFKSGISGEIIAQRNGCASVESVRKARIIFA